MKNILRNGVNLTIKEIPGPSGWLVYEMEADGITHRVSVCLTEADTPPDLGVDGFVTKILRAREQTQRARAAFNAL